MIGGGNLSSKDYDIILVNQDSINPQVIHEHVNEVYLDIIKTYIDQLDLTNSEKNESIDALIEEGKKGTI